MTRSDPSETGGLFVGRRPGTAPLRFRALPERGGEKRRRTDATIANLLFAAMVALCLLCWGPIPLACLWVTSQIDYLTGSVSLGVLVGFVSLGTLLFGTLALLKRIDYAWMLVRRAAGHDQRRGALSRIFAVTVVVCASAFILWFLLIHGPGNTLAPSTGSGSSS